MFFRVSLSFSVLTFRRATTFVCLHLSALVWLFVPILSTSRFTRIPWRPRPCCAAVSSPWSGIQSATQLTRTKRGLVGQVCTLLLVFTCIYRFTLPLFFFISRFRRFSFCPSNLSHLSPFAPGRTEPGFSIWEARTWPAL